MTGGGLWRLLGPTRLPGHDYSSGGPYFVTICTFKRRQFLSTPAVKDVVEGAWGEILQHFPGVALDAFVVMPNHVHGVLVIRDEQAVPVASQHAGKLQNHASLSVIMRSFKAAVTRELRLRGLHDGSAVWQQSYYDRIVRNEGELNRIREYIAYNPIAWRNDAENPDRQADEAYERAWGWLERP